MSLLAIFFWLLTTQQIPPRPQLVFDAPRYEFGKIIAGTVVQHSFFFRNTGTRPLVIANVGVSCGCTTSNWPHTPVLPGKAAVVRVNFNSTGKSGMQYKLLTIESNAPGGPAVLALVGKVVAGN